MAEKSKIKCVTMVGAGSWGTAVAMVIAENRPGLTVKMWSYEKSTAHSINQLNINTDFLPGIKLPSNIVATTSLKDALADTQGILIATPSKAIPDTMGKISKILNAQVPLSYLTKGFVKIEGEVMTISQAIEHYAPEYKNKVVGIYGPSHAEEVVKRFHTCLSVAGKKTSDRKFFCDLLDCDFLQCRETDDVLGLDLGGTLKNPAAIAAGIISVLPNCGDNLAGALMAESLKEMIALGKAIGARTETIVDISGTGDLVATALSPHSRNRRFGKEIAKQIIDTGSSLSFYDKIYLRFRPEHVLEKMSRNLNYLAEGAFAIEPLMELADLHSVSIPVYRSLYEVLLNKKDPSLLIETIKNPKKYNELYKDTKLHVKERQKGLEGVRGKTFKKLIVNKTIERFVSNNSDHNLEIDLVINNLKSFTETDNHMSHEFFNDEFRLIQELKTTNYEKSLRKIITIYLNEIIDHHNIYFKNIFFKSLSLQYFWKKLKGVRNSISVTGDIQDIHRIEKNVNIIYVARYKNILDSIHYIFAIKKNNLPVPRYFISSDAVHGRFSKFFIRNSGGFIINRSKLKNIVYKQCIIQYLSTLIRNGVPVLYFPELEPEKNSKISELSENFFQLLNEVMYQEATEIVLVPSEILYRNRVTESETNEIFSEQMNLHFSMPLFLSDFTRQSQAFTSIPELIQNIWVRDEIILPHHVICSILSEKNFSVNQGKLKKHIDHYLEKNHLPLNKSSRQIASEGIKFLLKNKIINKRGDNYTGIEIEKIKDYANIISRKKEQQGLGSE